MFSNRTNWNLSPNRLSQAIAQRRREGKPLLDLTVSNPTECDFTYDRAAILKSLSNPDSLSYRPLPQGLESARRAITAYYRDRGLPAPPEDVFLTTSTSEAYSFLFRTLCNPGDEILVPQPSYPLFDFLANIQDVQAVRYPLVYDHGWQIEFQALQAALTPRTRAAIVVHPNNPTGNFVKPAEIQQLNEMCASRQIAVIADEVFLDFDLGNHQSQSLVANEAALTFTLSGLSKMAGLPQMKVAWLVVSGPPTLKSQAIARLEVVADTYLSNSTPAQLAIPALLGLRGNFQARANARIRENLATLDREIVDHPSCSRLAIEGGWYAVIRAPATSSDEDLAIDVLTRTGVCVHPGHFYDFLSDGFLIVSLIAPTAQFLEGMRRLLSLF